MKRGAGCARCARDTIFSRNEYMINFHDIEQTAVSLGVAAKAERVILFGSYAAVMHANIVMLII